MNRLPLLLVVLLSVTWPAHLEAGFLKKLGKAAGNVVKDVGKTVEKAGNDTLKAGEKAANDTAKATEKAANDVTKTAEIAAKDIGKFAEKAGQDVGNTGVKAHRDVWWNVDKAGKDAINALEVTAKMVQWQAEGAVSSISEAEKRIREGKLLDAAWHLAVAPTEIQEEALSRAVIANNHLRMVGGVAASTYGGPGGAAAYATWITYRQTGNAELAIRTGMIAGTASAAMGAITEMPTDAVVAKTVLAGSVGGLAVAASGGDDGAILEAFVKGGSMIVAQEIFLSETGHKLDPKSAELEPMCVGSPGASCAPGMNAYVKDPQGDITINGEKYSINTKGFTAAEAARPHVGLGAKQSDLYSWGATEASKPMLAVSQIPGMNAMSLFHDQWAVSWHMPPGVLQATIPPAIVLTYVGTAGPVLDDIQQESARSQQGDDQNRKEVVKQMGPQIKSPKIRLRF